MISQEYRTNRARFPQSALVQYQGGWVAFSADGCRIVASGETVEQLEEKLVAAGKDAGQVVLEWLAGAQVNGGGSAPAPAIEMADEMNAGESSNLTTRKDRDEALRIRREWMRQIGMPEDEIAECCNPDLYDVDLAEEMNNLQAIARIKARNARRKQTGSAAANSDR